MLCAVDKPFAQVSEKLVLGDYVAVLAINVKQVRIMGIRVTIPYRLTHNQYTKSVLHAVHCGGPYAAAGRAANEHNSIHALCMQRDCQGSAKERTGVLFANHQFVTQGAVSGQNAA